MRFGVRMISFTSIHMIDFSISFMDKIPNSVEINHEIKNGLLLIYN